MKKIAKVLVSVVVPLLVGGIVGVLSVAVIDKIPFSLPVKLAILCASVVLGIYSQIIIHEAGHLLGGLVSGYRFVSFRVGSFMLIRDGSRLRVKRFSLAGTGGQCLMAPPDMRDGRFPVMLYNIAGPLANIISAAMLTALYFVVPSPSVAAVCLVVAVIAAFLGLMNGIPMRAEVDNDGRNALSLGKNPAAMRALWIQLKINEYTSMGVRLKDMPRELFDMPDDNELNNALVASVAVFRANLLMDMHSFDEADALMRHIMSIKTAVPGIYRTLISCDRVLCRIIAGEKAEKAGKLLTKEHKKVMHAMKNFPSVLRTGYVLALAENDLKKAEGMLSTFDKMAEKYPYPSDICSERELMDIARSALTNEQPESIM